MKITEEIIVGTRHAGELGIMYICVWIPLQLVLGIHGGG